MRRHRNAPPAAIAYRVASASSRRLGAHLDDGGTSFAVFSRGEAVDLCLLDDDGAERRVPLTERTARRLARLRRRASGPGSATATGCTGPWDPGHGHRFNPAKLLARPLRPRASTARCGLDPAVLGPAAGRRRHRAGRRATRRRSCRTRWSSTRRFDWQGDRPPDVPWADTVVYELHVKGFTAAHPGVPEDLRGTYAGLAHPAAIEHLLPLGVTTVELLPVHQLRSEPRCCAAGPTNYWGYNTLGFFAPHAGYSARGARGEQVSEFRDMVRALHAAGIEVLLDVVYNHTAEGGADGPTLSWRGLDNAAYYRLAGGRRYVDSPAAATPSTSGTRAPCAMVTDSLRYWVQEMHVDGFRFDLAPALARGADGVRADRHLPHRDRAGPGALAR